MTKEACLQSSITLRLSVVEFDNGGSDISDGLLTTDLVKRRFVHLTVTMIDRFETSLVISDALPVASRQPRPPYLNWTLKTGFYYLSNYCYKILYKSSFNRKSVMDDAINSILNVSRVFKFLRDGTFISVLFPSLSQTQCSL